MTKIDTGTVIEIALGVVLGGIIVGILSHMFGGWFAQHGIEIHGVKPDGTEPK